MAIIFFIYELSELIKSNKYGTIHHTLSTNTSCSFIRLKSNTIRPFSSLSKIGLNFPPQTISLRLVGGTGMYSL